MTRDDQRMALWCNVYARLADSYPDTIHEGKESIDADKALADFDKRFPPEEQAQDRSAFAPPKVAAQWKCEWCAQGKQDPCYAACSDRPDMCLYACRNMCDWKEIKA
jgi:hypothetical protein